MAFLKPTCRICLQSNEDRMSSIFELDTCSNNLHIYQKIEECSGIKIILHEKVPSLICRTCYSFLTISYKFRSICRNSNDYFQESVIGVPKLEEDVKQDVKKHPGIENIVEKNRNITINAPPTERASSMPPTLPHKTLLDESSSSHTNSEDQNVDFYEEMWLEGEEVTYNSQPQVVADEQIQEVHTGGQEKKQTVKSSKNHKQVEAKTPSKTLGISSDGAAVIRDKKSSQKSNKIKKGKQRHICDICGNIYDRRYALESHMRRHRQEKPFECEICNQAFHCNFELTRHIRKHTGSRPYECSYCRRSFGDRSTLMKHERIHRNERPYSCETCGKSFTYSSVLKSHQLTHTGEKPYICELCGKRFARSHHLRAHLETLQHQNDPLSKVLLKKIKRVQEGESFATI